MFRISNNQAAKLFHEIFPYTNLPAFLHYVTVLYHSAFVIISLAIILFLLRYILRFKQDIQEKAVFLELTPPAYTQKSAYTTQQLFSVLHSIGSQKTFIDRLLGKKIVLSFEIVSIKQEGIRYIIRTTPDEVKNIKRNIISYLPSVKMREIDDYLFEKETNGKPTILEYKLRKRFPLPLAKQNVLEKHDPVAYITGMMTNVKPNEVIALQVVVSPAHINTKSLAYKIARQEDVLSELERIEYSIFVRIIPFLFKHFLFPLLHLVREIVFYIFDILTANAPKVPSYAYANYQNQLVQNKQKPVRVISPFEHEMLQSIQEKIDQSLFETTIRVLIQVNNSSDRTQRIQGVKSFFAPFAVPKYQSLIAKYPFPIIDSYLRYFSFKKRLLSPFTNSSSTILSVSEVSDLYHFPFAQTTRTEDMAKVLIPDLPAPLLLKNEKNLAVVFGKNKYGNTETLIGLTDDDRSRHVFMEGQTGSGKSTVLFHMIKEDMQEGKGICLVDPHGDLVEDLLHVIPEERINDVVYINPFDIKYPMRINLLELTPGLDEDEQELEKEQIAESIISIFRRVFSEDEKTNAHRIERILRNCIYTAFYAKYPTIFTVNKLLTNESFRQEVLARVDNEDLLDFWKEEFGKAGDWQVFKMIDGVTAKVERFLFSPVAKRILEKPKSTIYFDQLLDEGKIILCNVSEGKVGEDTSRLLGTTIITKIHLAILRRARMDKELRKPCYLYIDEFQNFATKSFTKLLSGGRKFGLRVTIAEQSTTQQDDDHITQRILANVGTVICFRTASPVDEELMLAQFAPLVKKGDLGNLPRFHFYIKLGALEPQEPFSGQTFPITLIKDPEKVKRIVEASRKNYASIYEKPKVVKPKKKQKKEVEEEKDINKSLV